MANTITFNEGMDYLTKNGLPANCYWALSRRIVGGTSAGGSFVAADTLAGGIGEITGYLYARGTAARPGMSAQTLSFTQMTWTNGTAVDWPSDVRSIVLVTVNTGTAGSAIAAANLQAGGAARDMSQANTTEKVTPTLSFAAGN